MIYKNIEKHGIFVIQIPPAPPKRKPIHLDGFFFLLKKGGFERPLRKHACGMFLGRGKIHDLATHPNGRGRKVILF